jgi:hypothetical protein
MARTLWVPRSTPSQQRPSSWLWAVITTSVMGRRFQVSSQIGLPQMPVLPARHPDLRETILQEQA